MAIAIGIVPVTGTASACIQLDLGFLANLAKSGMLIETVLYSPVTAFSPAMQAHAFEPRGRSASRSLLRA